MLPLLQFHQSCFFSNIATRLSISRIVSVICDFPVRWNSTATHSVHITRNFVIICMYIDCFAISHALRYIDKEDTSCAV